MGAVKLGQFRYADLLRWPAGERWQLCGGHAMAMAPPNVTHQTVVFELGRQLGNTLLGKPCRAFAGPIGVRLPHGQEADGDVRDYFEPDLIVVCDPKKIDAAGIRGAPDFVIEVQSPSTAAYDQIDKRLVYERAGVREYWLIDASGGVLIRYVHDGQKFAAPEILHARGVVTVQALPELTLDLDFLVAIKVQEEPSLRSRAEPAG